MSIEISHLTHTYQADSPFQSTAVHDVSFTINDGDFMALIGHTGSGKSTLAQHLNGLIKPTSGQILLDGVDINAKTTDRREVRRKVGLVFQYPENQLFEETVEKDIAFGPKNLGLSENEISERVHEAMARLGLDYDTIAKKSPFDLSGGQMRRVAIAGVIAMRPRILVLDEPTAGLDPRGRERLLGMIGELHREGTTIVMISHSMDDVARFATRIAVMSRGELAMLDTPTNIFAQPEKLAQMSLDVPAVCRLAQLLRKKGIAMPEVYLPDDAEKAIMALAGKGGASHA